MTAVTFFLIIATIGATSATGTLSCKSLVPPSVTDLWCDNNGCGEVYPEQCTLKGDSKVGKDQQCVSINPNYAKTWCMANGCGEAYPTICTMRGDLNKKDDRAECKSLRDSVPNSWCR